MAAKSYKNRNDLLQNVGVLIYPHSYFVGKETRYNFGTYNVNFNNVSFILFPATTVTFYAGQEKLITLSSPANDFQIVNSYTNNKCANKMCNVTRIEIQSVTKDKEARDFFHSTLGGIYFDGLNLKGTKTFIEAKTKAIPIQSSKFSLFLMPNVKVDFFDGKVDTGLSSIHADNTFSVNTNANPRERVINSINIEFVEPTVQTYITEGFSLENEFQLDVKTLVNIAIIGAIVFMLYKVYSRK